jgi:hypothetical protein
MLWMTLSINWSQFRFDLVSSTLKIVKFKFTFKIRNSKIIKIICANVESKHLNKSIESIMVDGKWI